MGLPSDQIRRLDTEAPEELLSQYRLFMSRIQQEAKQIAAELDVPEAAGYDILALMYGQAGLGERDFFEKETALPPAAATSSLQPGIARLEEGGKGPAAEQNDEELVQRVLQGDKAAFEGLFALYYPVILRDLYQRTRSDDVAQELTGDTFERAFRTLIAGQYTWHHTSFGVWLSFVARNTFMDWRRKQRRDAWNDSEEILDEERISRIVWQCMSELSPRYQEILVLHYLYGFTLAETAQRLQVSKQTCALYCHRALRALQRRVHDADIGDEARSFDFQTTGQWHILRDLLTLR